MGKFVVTPNPEKTVTMTIHVEESLREAYTSLSAQTNHSRNELVSMALRFALQHMEVKAEE